ncbi:PDZ domain-containing protein [Pseudolactococcus yaeyamensis]
MNNTKVKNYYFYQLIFFSVIVVLLSIFYYFSISMQTYIGISTRKIGDSWKIVMVQKNGAAEQTGLLKNDIILSVDEKILRKIKLLKSG